MIQPLSFIKRCEEVMQFTLEKRKEHRLYAGRLADCSDCERDQYMVPYLETELDMLQEIRTIWPYVLMIPTDPVVVDLCGLYQTTPEELGPILDRKIHEVNRLIEVIETRLMEIPVEEEFWTIVRDEILGKLTREARELLDNFPC